MLLETKVKKNVIKYLSFDYTSKVSLCINKLLSTSLNDYLKRDKNIHSYHSNSLDTNYFLLRFKNNSGHKLIVQRVVNYGLN